MCTSTVPNIFFYIVYYKTIGFIKLFLRNLYFTMYTFCTKNYFNYYFINIGKEFLYIMLINFYERLI